MEDEYLKNITSLGATEVEILVKHYWHDVWQYAFFLTRREHLAEDIAQDTFISALRFIGSFRGDSSVKTWLFKIARNTAINYQKSAFLKKVTLIGFLKNEQSIHSAEDHYFKGVLTDQIWGAVLDLPQRYREILILHAHYGLTHSELSELLSISNGTVKSRLHRARNKLKRTMLGVDEHVETHV